MAGILTTGEPLAISDDEIHLWVSYPERVTDADLLARYPQLLTADEREKQQRFRFARDRHAALVTRAFVRDLLSAYAAPPPESWRFEYGPNGKPELIEPPLPLRFNLSHTRGLVTCAVTLHDAIGCDVEFVQRRNDVHAIARTHFSKPERDELGSLPQAQQRSRFFDYWTLKESWIKASGEGIFRVPLADFWFTIGSPTGASVNDNIALSFAPRIAQDSANWQSWLFYPSLEHRIAVSVRTGAERGGRGPGVGPAYRFRYFESVPLQEQRELYW